MAKNPCLTCGGTGLLENGKPCPNCFAGETKPTKATISGGLNINPTIDGNKLLEKYKLEKRSKLVVWSLVILSTIGLGSFFIHNYTWQTCILLLNIQLIILFIRDIVLYFKKSCLIMKSLLCVMTSIYLINVFHILINIKYYQYMMMAFAIIAIILSITWLIRNKS